MKETVLVLGFVLWACNALGDEKVLLECKNLGEGELARVQVVRPDANALFLVETGSDASVTRRPLNQNEFDSRVIALSDYQGYSRVLRKQGTAWVIHWSCGEDISVECSE